VGYGVRCGAGCGGVRVGLGGHGGEEGVYEGGGVAAAAFGEGVDDHVVGFEVGHHGGGYSAVVAEVLEGGEELDCDRGEVLWAAFYSSCVEEGVEGAFGVEGGVWVSCGAFADEPADEFDGVVQARVGLFFKL